MLGALAYSIQENLGQENLGLFPESNFNLIGRVFSFTVFWLSLTLAPSTIVIWNSFNAGEEAIDKSRFLGVKNQEVRENADVGKLPEVDLDAAPELPVDYEDLILGLQELAREGKANEKMTVDRVR